MSNYIMDLRKIVGHRALLQVGASVILEDSQGRILLQKRRDNHCWGYAGGSVELDEVVELRFFSVEEIPENISPPIQVPLRKWIEKKCRY